MIRQTGPEIPVSQTRTFLIAVLFSGLWINISEVARYFLFVRPLMQDGFPMLPDVAPISVSIFASWMVWDMILVFVHAVIVWCALDRFGTNLRIAVLAGGFVWLTIFVILWLGLFNMALATPAIVAVALPLSLLEMTGAAIIIALCRRRASAMTG